MAIALFVLAAFMSTAAVVVTSRANPGVPLTFWKAPPRDPFSVKVLRGLAIGCALFGSISLDEQVAWWWGVALIVAVLTVPFKLVRLMVHDQEPASPGL